MGGYLGRAKYLNLPVLVILRGDKSGDQGVNWSDGSHLWKTNNYDLIAVFWFKFQLKLWNFERQFEVLILELPICTLDFTPQLIWCLTSTGHPEYTLESFRQAVKIMRTEILKVVSAVNTLVLFFAPAVLIFGLCTCSGCALVLVLAPTVLMFGPNSLGN